MEVILPFNHLKKLEIFLFFLFKPALIFSIVANTSQIASLKSLSMALTAHS